MKFKARSLRWLTGLSLGLALVSTAFVLAETDQPKDGDSFNKLAPKTDVVYLLANSSIVVGPDVKGPAEDITFSGTVDVPKFPVQGFNRRKLPSGRYQIDFELTQSRLQGESYLMNGPIVLGEHPDLRSLGTITQSETGKDYPADFIVQRKVLLHTPKGVMYNEEPVPVRGRIDSIPPVRYERDGRETNVFRGKELPIALLDDTGNLAGWFYSKVHVAYAVDPAAVYRVPVSGFISVKVGDQEEAVAVQGPVEFVEHRSHKGTLELIKAGLRGNSKLLNGPVMFSEAFAPEDKFSYGKLGAASEFDLYLEVKSPSGTLLVEQPVHVKGWSSTLQKIGEESLGPRGMVPVYSFAFNEAGEANQAITDESGKQVGTITRVNLSAEKVAGHRPCCPIGKDKATAKTASAKAAGTK
jgi:hypothetical protein